MKGLVHSERTKSIMFLQAVRELAYVDVITTLQAHIDTFLSYQADFGYLPPNLCMMGLAVQMNKNACARVRDVVPRIAHRLVWDNKEGYHSTPQIQDFQVPQAYRMEAPCNRQPYEGLNRGRLQDHRRDGQEDGREVFRCPAWDGGREQFHRPERTGGDRDGPRGRYACPDHNRCAWDPDITCAACKRHGHPTSNYDMLAMALFLDKYISTSIPKEDRNKIEMVWLQRWKEKLGNPSRMPRKVMRAYLEYMDISLETLDTQMDWECWPVDDDVEDFGVDVSSPLDL